MKSLPKRETTKIYHVWIQSLHKITYTIGFFFNKEEAETISYNYPSTATGCYSGVTEIEVFK